MFSTIVAMAAVSVLSPCNDTKLSEAAVESHLLQNVLQSEQTRSEVVADILGGKSLRCLRVLQNFIASVEKKKERAEFASVHLLMLEVASSAEVSGAIAQLERESFAQKSSAALSVLHRVSPVRFRAGLAGWVKKIAESTRVTHGLQILDERLYGKNALPQTEVNFDFSRVDAPIFLERYLSYLVETKTKLGSEQLSDLNVIFAAASTSDRKTFSLLLTQALGTDVSLWLTSFRKEPVQLQARLFPLFEDLGGAEIVRELMWLSQNHADLRMRGLANRSLDRVLGKAGR